MEADQIVIVATVGVILGVTVLSGPLVGAVDFTEPEPELSAPPGTGTASVSAVTISAEDSTLAPGEFGAGSYYLTVPHARATVDSVTGAPILAYRISIPELGHASESVYILSPEDAGEMTLAIESMAVSPDRIDATEYEAEITVELRDDTGTESLASRYITVTVTDR